MRTMQTIAILYLEALMGPFIGIPESFDLIDPLA